jgi:hypothetical protein
MQQLKAVVRNGRLVLDEPTDLPQGAEIELVAVDPAMSRTTRRKLTVDELLAARLEPSPGVGPVSLSDMDNAIADGAAGRGSV